MTMYTLTVTFRTKSEAKDAIKRGELIHIVKADGTVLDKANGSPFLIKGKLDHYKEWTGEATVVNGKIKTIR
jgi:hypothetical protein